MKSAIENELAHENLTAKRIAAKLNKLIDHERTVITPDGTVLGKEADANVQLKAVDLTAKLLALYPNARGEGAFRGQLHQHSHLHLQAESAAILAWIARNRRLPTDVERAEIQGQDVDAGEKIPVCDEPSQNSGK